ncbi:protein fmp52 [Aspergillus flavus]|nr:protein fmp52 [Aspergillus flavus]
MTTAAVFGCTGAVGGQILATLLASDAFSSVKTVSRRLPNAQSPKLQTLEEGDITKWGGLIASLSPKPSIVFNAVGTTRAAAGGIANQWKIDHDLCIENAKAAKEAGVKTYVFISSGGTRGFFSRYVPYSKMKIGVEDAIKELDFEQAIILRPGLILQREKPKAALLENIVQNLNKLGQGVQDMIGQDQTVIGRAAVAAARMAEEGKAPSKYWVLEQADIGSVTDYFQQAFGNEFGFVPTENSQELTFLQPGLLTLKNLKYNMKFTAALALLPLAASAWEVTTGYWKSSETDVCAKTFLPKGFHVTINDLLPGQKVFFFSDDECEDLEFSVHEVGTVKLESRVKSFTVLDFEQKQDLK